MPDTMVGDCSRPFQANSDLFLRRRRIAPTYKKYPAWSDGKPETPEQLCRTRRGGRDFFGAVSISGAPERHMSNAPFVTRLQRWARGLGADVDTAFARQQSGITRQTPDG